MLEPKTKKFRLTYRRQSRYKAKQQYHAKTEHILDFYTEDVLFYYLNENHILRVV